MRYQDTSNRRGFNGELHVPFATPDGGLELNGLSKGGYSFRIVMTKKEVIRTIKCWLAKEENHTWIEVECPHCTPPKAGG